MGVSPVKHKEGKLLLFLRFDLPKREKSPCKWYEKASALDIQSTRNHHQGIWRKNKVVTAQVALPAKYPDPGQSPCRGGRGSPKQDNDHGPTKDLRTN